eukprot:12927458-Prorocentrum_lima.AAC.1
MGDAVNARGLLHTSCDKGCAGPRYVAAPSVGPAAQDVAHCTVRECPHVVVAEFLAAPHHPARYHQGAIDVHRSVGMRCS